MTAALTPHISRTDPLIGKNINGYQFIARAGSGGFGAVYVVRHPRLHKRFRAAKYLQINEDNEVLQVEREIRILETLNHPHIVQIDDFVVLGKATERSWLIIMELIYGGSLSQLLKHLNGRLLALEIIVELAWQLADALSYVHSQKILHLDLKPANILVKPMPDQAALQFVLSDFGISRYHEPGRHHSKYGGTPAYMSPEHFGASEPGPSSDIYSFGVVLYELVTGRLPFNGATYQLFRQHLYEAPIAPSRLVATLPPALDALILKALAKAPAQRYASLRDLQNDLDLVGQELGRYSPASFAERVSREQCSKIVHQRAAVLQGELEQATAQATETVRLTLIDPQQHQRDLNVSGPSLVVGRSKQADLSLPEATQLSRRHFQIDLGDGDFFVTDLESRHGTYLDNDRLPAGERVAWLPEQRVFAGGYSFYRGDQTGAAASIPALPSHEVEKVAQELVRQHQQPHVKLRVMPEIVYVQVGVPVLVQAQITPFNTLPTMYRLQASPGPGVQLAWVQLPHPRRLLANESVAFDIGIFIPNDAAARAGAYEMSLGVVADDPTIQDAAQVLQLIIQPTVNFLVSLNPIEVRHKRNRRRNVATLTLNNRGTAPAHLTIGTETAQGLVIKPAATAIQVEAGRDQTVRLRFQVQRGQTQSHFLRYGIVVSSAGGEARRVYGSYVIPASARRLTGGAFLWLLASALLVALVTMLAYYWSQGG